VCYLSRGVALAELDDNTLTLALAVIVGIDRCDLLVLVKPRHGFLQLTGSLLEFKAADDFIHRYAGKGEYSVFLGILP
jgi:hypothetical protein